MSNIRYFTIKVSKSNIWQTSNDTIKLLLVSKIPHCYPFASKQQFNWSARHFSCCLLQFWIRSNRLPGVGVDKRPGVVVAVRMKSDIIHYDIIHVFFYQNEICLLCFSGQFPLGLNGYFRIQVWDDLQAMAEDNKHWYNNMLFLRKWTAKLPLRWCNSSYKVLIVLIIMITYLSL